MWHSKSTVAALLIFASLLGCAKTVAPTPVAAGPASCPLVLGPAELRPYIAACVENKARICKELDWDFDFVFDFASKDPDSAYAASCQGFALPDNQTVFTFGSLGVTGAVVFNTTTRQIITVLPWSHQLARGREEVMFDRTFFRLRQDPSGKWGVTALVFAIIGDRHDPTYETWEFHYGPTSGGYSTRYIMSPPRPAPPSTTGQ